MDRPFLSLGIASLEDVYQKCLVNKDYAPIQVLLNELSFRSTKRATILAEKITADKAKPAKSPTRSQKDILKLRIQKATFEDTMTMWRNFAFNLSKNPELILKIRERWDLIYARWKAENEKFFITYENYYPEHGILSLFDYNVNTSKVHRKIILIELLRAHIPPISNYHEWGLPKTVQRKEKMRLTLSGLAFPRRNQKNLEGAVKVWETDLEFITQFF